ncbi:MAG: RNA-binding transcriptional accessory protein, partial [Pedobacter sp.]
MSHSNYKKIASELSVQEKQVEVTVKLLDEGGTVPFISRYRKEMTGSLDEVQVAAIRDRMQQLIDLDKRREAILKSMTELNVLTAELERQIKNAETMVVLEDIYLPYKPKRKTKASAARERGLQPLADKILEQLNIDVELEASKYIDEEKGVATSADALAGARDILAEFMAEKAELRSKMRELFLTRGSFHSKLIKGKEEAGQKYKDYFDWTEAVKSAPSHRVLALRRAE